MAPVLDVAEAQIGVERQPENPLGDRFRDRMVAPPPLQVPETGLQVERYRTGYLRLDSRPCEVTRQGIPALRLDHVRVPDLLCRVVPGNDDRRGDLCHLGQVLGVAGRQLATAGDGRVEPRQPCEEDR